ncbi:putative Mitochondrial tumor suppressor 1 protein [Danaus plexippus plexippus]|uniref:Mitochondrial tumor suppressor 1 protein n=1 Tax=Danaus plexippus plexippus TaxID=278856 RepID=A0A212EHV9_DANPL|nr:putative Mitochondrial tumor suppressor 1 protein [Danaus plexippus plexippus]
MEVSSKEEANSRLQAAHFEEVSALAKDVKGLKDTIDTLKQEVAESRSRLHSHSEIERTLRAQLEAARSEVERAKSRASDKSANRSNDSSRDKSTNKSYNTCDAACDPVYSEVEEYDLGLRSKEELSSDATELAAEVLSLRAVIELKNAELSSLRDARSELPAERQRRIAAEREACSARHAAEELRERAAARQREADRLRDENRRLGEIAARDRDRANRLAALNEELRYKLRQKSQVVSLLAGGGYIERTPMRTRTSSGDSGRSASPGPETPPSPASSPAPDSPPLPAVKGVVEKHDSVSWVLEIEETPEEMASRLARRSSFRAGASPSGVKRRGGGSPGSSPAPVTVVVLSLRAVIELKNAELSSLRDARSELPAERQRRIAAEREACSARHAAEELRERAAARQREADRLRDENRRLGEIAARDRDRANRLAALNEELRYKLRQKSQVVSLLAGGGYIERTPMRTRTSSGDSGRSASPGPETPPSPASSPAPDSPPLPAVKGVVEKHDSVSWVLEIEETPEEMASRLARRSSFRAGASPSGVKRRGGGSPGSSPAPASPAPNASKLFRPGDLDFPPQPPPLKESAGEAIYIYDDRQY